MGTVDRKGGEVERTTRREPSTERPAQRPVSAPAGPVELLGNRAMLHLLRSGRLQRKPRESGPGQPLERSPEEEEVAPEADATGEGHSLAPPPAGGSPLSGLGGGEPLPRDIRTRMESLFGASFDDVRVHTGVSAASTAKAVSAHAFTVGTQIVFGANQYSPDTAAGQRLLAHELAHVVQQGRGHGEGTSRTDQHAAEREADEAAESATAGDVVDISEPTGLGVQKEGNENEEPPPAQSASYDPNFMLSRLMVANDGGQVTATLNGRIIVSGTAHSETAVGWAAAGGTVLILVDEIAPSVNFTSDAPTITREEAPGWHFHLRFRIHENVPIIPRLQPPKPPHVPAPKKPKPKPAPPPKPAPSIEPPVPEQPGLVPAPLITVEPVHRPPEKRVTAPLAPASPSELIDRHTSFGNLDEEALGAELLERALAGDIATVEATLDALGSTDRDDVSLAITSAATDWDLEELTDTDEGRKLLLRLYDELTSGHLDEDESKQAERVMMARAQRIDPNKIRDAEQNAMVIPFSGIGMTKFSSASLSVERLPNGKLWVRSHMKREHWKDARRLPSTAFAVGLGREFDPDEVVGLYLYDEGGKTIYLPAIFLLQLSNQESSKAATMAAEAFVTGLTLGVGGGVVAGGEMAAEQAVARGVWATWGLRALRVADWTAMGAGIASTLINDHRGLILKHFGKDGEEFLKLWGSVERVIAVYGLARGALALGQTAIALRSTLRKWRALQAQLKGLAAEEEQALNQIALQTEEALDNIERAQSARRTGSGMQPPEDPYDVEAWKAYYEQNPDVGRSVGAASVDDPDVAGLGEAPPAAPRQLGPGPGPTLVSLDAETIDELVEMWKAEMVKNPGRSADYQRYIKNLRERRNLLSANRPRGAALSGEQAEKEMQFLTQSRHKRLHTPEGETVPDLTQGTDWAGEVKNWNILYPTRAEVDAAERGLLPPKLNTLAQQVARRRLRYGSKQTVIIDIRGQLNLQGVDAATAAHNRYLLHQFGRVVADAVGLPIEQIQIITW